MNVGAGAHTHTHNHTHIHTEAVLPKFMNNVTYNLINALEKYVNEFIFRACNFTKKRTFP